MVKNYGGGKAHRVQMTCGDENFRDTSQSEKIFKDPSFRALAKLMYVFSLDLQTKFLVALPYEGKKFS